MIRTLVLGYGLAGRVFHAPLVAATAGYELTAVVTGSPERAAQARADHPGVEVIGTAEAALARAGDFDLAVIATPNDTHAPLALAAIEAGLNVVVDKPVAVTTAQARQVVDAAAARGVVLTVFQNRRWDGDLLTLRDVLDSGELGEIRQFESAFEWFKPELGPKRKDRVGTEAGGGILYDLGPHLVDQALLLFGPVESVHAELDARRPGALADDDDLLTLRHANGVRSRLWMSAVAPAPRFRFRVVGSRAVFTAYGLDPQESQARSGLRPDQPGFGAYPEGAVATVAGPDGERSIPLRAGEYRRFYELLREAITDGGPVPVDPADAVAALALIEDVTA